jgi:SfnB family sulfur acquisition oxidoreductase
LDEFSQSGLWGITIPKAYGGAGVSFSTAAEVAAIISAADSSLGQIPQNHYYMVEAVRLDGSEEQKRFFFKRVLEGDRFGNAFVERGTKTVFDFQARLTASGDTFLLNGKKFYSTGAVFAHWVPAVAKDDQGRIAIVFVRRDAPGVTIIDDWSGFGQRTTASGTALFENVVVEPFYIIDHQAAFDRPTPMGAVAQIFHTAVDAGIARAALAETLAFVRQYTRPWIDSGQEHGYEDPYTIHQIGELEVRVHASDALLERAGRFVDTAVASPTQEHIAQASIAVAEAKALATEVSLLTTNKLFELAGTRSTLEEYNLDRHWRNARTHTLHDPVRWKYHAIGNYWLNGVQPPRHGAS